jgi:hypothetical protein
MGIRDDCTVYIGYGGVPHNSAGDVQGINRVCVCEPTFQHSDPAERRSLPISVRTSLVFSQKAARCIDVFHKRFV